MIIRGLLKNITKRQNIYTIQNNSENGKNPQVHDEKYQKCPDNHIVNNAHNIFGTFSFDRLDLTPNLNDFFSKSFIFDTRF